MWHGRPLLRAVEENSQIIAAAVITRVTAQDADEIAPLERRERFCKLKGSARASQGSVDDGDLIEPELRVVQALLDFSHPSFSVGIKLFKVTGLQHDFRPIQSEIVTCRAQCFPECRFEVSQARTISGVTPSELGGSSLLKPWS